MERMLLEPRELVIIGDFNKHVDLANDPLSLKFSDCLVSLGIQQHIHEPTHRADHTLDLVISRKNTSIVSDLKLGELAISDHSHMLINISLVKPSLYYTQCILEVKGNQGALFRLTDKLLQKTAVQFLLSTHPLWTY